MDLLVPAPAVLPLAGAALSIVLGRWRWAQRVVGVSVLSSVLACSIVLAVAVDDGPVAVQGGGVGGDQQHIQQVGNDRGQEDHLVITAADHNARRK